MADPERAFAAQNIRERLTPVFVRHNVKKAVLFGSASRDDAVFGSDLDIMVDSGLKGLSFFGLLEDVCNSVDCGVDLIDVQDIIPDSEVDMEIKRTGVTIYELA